MVKIYKKFTISSRMIYVDEVEKILKDIGIDYVKKVEIIKALEHEVPMIYFSCRCCESGKYDDLVKMLNGEKIYISLFEEAQQ